MMPKTWGPNLHFPSILTFWSRTRGKRHRAHSFGILPICQNPKKQLIKTTTQIHLIKLHHLLHNTTSPACSVENRTISEHAAVRPKPFPVLGEDNFFVGNLKITASSVFIVLPLHVDKPVTSPQLTNHQSSLLLSMRCSLELGLVTIGGEGEGFGGETERWLLGRVRFNLGAVWVSKMMLMAALTSFLAMWSALMISMSVNSEPTMDLTVDRWWSLTLLPIGTLTLSSWFRNKEFEKLIEKKNGERQHSSKPQKTRQKWVIVNNEGLCYCFDIICLAFPPYLLSHFIMFILITTSFTLYWSQFFVIASRYFIFILKIWIKQNEQNCSI